MRWPRQGSVQATSKSRSWVTSEAARVRLNSMIQSVFQVTPASFVCALSHRTVRGRASENE